MSLFKRKNSPYWWVKLSHKGRRIQQSSGTADKGKAREYHDKLKASLWDQERLGIKPSRAWNEAVVRYLAETSHKASQFADKAHLRWVDRFLGGLKLNQIDRELLDRIHPDQAKARKAIAVPLSAAAVVVLRGQIGKHSTHVFSYRGNPVRQVNTKAWRQALLRAGIAEFRWHDLRHTWASWHAQAGTPLHVLQELGGWECVEMVRKYAHLSTVHLAEYVDRVSSLRLVAKDGVATNQLHAQK